jgi:hypothetical protein
MAFPGNAACARGVSDNHLPPRITAGNFPVVSLIRSGIPVTSYERSASDSGPILE